VHADSQNRNLQHQQHRKEHPEIPVLRLVVKNLHPENTTQPAEASRRHEQRSLRYPPCVSSGSPFIDAHKSESDDVHNSYYGKSNHNHSLTIHLSIPHDKRHLLPKILTEPIKVIQPDSTIRKQGQTSGPPAFVFSMVSFYHDTLHDASAPTPVSVRPATARKPDPFPILLGRIVKPLYHNAHDPLTDNPQ
jgi:hypothetical protein